jgi:ERCC4-type nuclease
MPKPTAASIGKKRSLSAIDRVHAFMGVTRVCDSEQITRALGPKFIQTIRTLVGKGEIASPAPGIFCLPSIHDDDPRVLLLMAANKVSPTSPKIIEKRRAKAEEKEASASAARLKAKTVVDRTRAYAKKNQVFQRSDAIDAIGRGAAGALTTLLQTGDIVQIERGLYALPNATHETITARQIEIGGRFAEIATEIASYIDANPTKVFRAASPEFKYWESGYLKRVYTKIPGYPEIYGMATRGNNVAWRSKDNDHLSAAAARHIATLVFPIGTSFSEIMEMINDPAGPPKLSIRSGRYTPENSPPSREHQELYTASLKPHCLTIPIPEPVILKIAHTEPDDILSLLARVPNLNVIRADIPVGDYVVDGKLIIERKTTEDLIKSLLDDDGRMSRQIDAMRSSNCRCSLIVEGGLMRKPHPKITINKRAVMRSRLIYQYGIDVIETIDHRETAYAITVAIRDLILDPDERSIARPARARSKHPREKAIQLLRTIKGVSPARAELLLDTFGTVFGVASAAPEQIASLKGIGQTLASEIANTFQS